MSSFFRSPNEVSSSVDDTGQEETASSNDTPSIEDSNVVSRVKTLSSDASGPDPTNPSSRVLLQERHQHKDLLLHSLLEEKALAHAIQYLNSNNSKSDDHVYSAQDPAVQELAKAKYEYMTEQLSTLGVLGTGYDDESLRPLRDRYRQGLDSLLESHDASIDALPGPSGPNVLPSALSSVNLSNAFEKALIAPNSVVKHDLPPFGPNRPVMPTALQRLIESHQIMNLSRYEREFVQIGVLGKGGYGKVFKCQHRLDGMEYGIKKIVLSSAKIQRIRERGQTELDNVLAEIRAIARLDHPNIVRYFGGWLEYAPVESTASSFRRFSPSPKLLHAARDSDDSHTDPVSADPFDGHFIQESFSRPPIEDLDIVFETSDRVSTMPEDSTDVHGKAVASDSLSKKLPSKRRESAATISSIRSKKSTVHSIGVSDGEPDDDVETIPRSHISFEPSTSIMDSYVSSSRPARLHNATATPQLTLHIQMGLHPLTLTDYLNAEAIVDDVKVGDEKNLKHCYHKRTSLRIILAIMDGVDYLHSAGMIHRDLKPSNIFLSRFHSLVAPAGCVDLSRCESCTDDGVIGRGQLGMRIGDFGLVTAMARPDDVAPDTAPKAVGTEFYRPDTAYSVATEKLDVFSLGVILFELLWKLDTKMERHETLKALKTGHLPQGFSLSIGDSSGEIEACIKAMVDDNEKARLSCKDARDRITGILLKI